MSKSRPFRHLAHFSSVRDQPIVFLTVVTHARQAVLANDFAHRLLRGLWQRSADRNGWFVGDYVVMPDHVHLFARAETRADSLSAWMKMWKSVSSRQLNAAVVSTSRVWQEEYFDRYLRSAESYEEKWCYVRNNPVRAGLVIHADLWPYCGRICDLGEL